MTTPEQTVNLQKQVNVLARLLEVSLILNSNLALAPLLRFIMEAACEITQSEASSILLYSETTDELRFVASNSPGTPQEQMAEIAVPMDGSIAGQIVRDKKPIVIQDADADARIYRDV